MNKQIRKEKMLLKYKKRIRRWVANMHIYVDKSGNYVYEPKATDLIKDNAYLEFKNSSVLCSCYMCSKHWKYSRKDKKSEDRRLICEALEN